MNAISITQKIRVHPPNPRAKHPRLKLRRSHTQKLDTDLTDFTDCTLFIRVHLCNQCPILEVAITLRPKYPLLTRPP